MLGSPNFAPERRALRTWALVVFPSFLPVTVFPLPEVGRPLFFGRRWPVTGRAGRFLTGQGALRYASHEGAEKEKKIGLLAHWRTQLSIRVRVRNDLPPQGRAERDVGFHREAFCFLWEGQP